MKICYFLILPVMYMILHPLWGSFSLFTYECGWITALINIVHLAF